ncbi:transcription termination factor Rho [Streptosporangium brasiliense]|uniref:Transcription termination factor Rho n=1 Tax=Streptosporangium brasiliense TaxID=47480 RepID=A0ABT9R498_9ACTN|nr:transcription termination factor Rho [Streptosporangium brasiliense]MDP9863707.1 transcription termination factor Rho [Streptosporangium brasiliense]
MTTETTTRKRPRPPQPRESDAYTETVAGLLDVRDRTGYLRTRGYLPGPDDVRVPHAQIRQYGLRPGDHVVATARTPYERLVEVESVNGSTDWRRRPDFADMTPIHPRERLRLETESVTTRVVDLFAPVGKGQRGLIVAPPKAGKTMVLRDLAAAITRNHPDCHLMVVLVGERPEEVTEMRESVHGEVAASTFDRPDRDHTALAELAVERAKRLAESGRDVVVLLDSLTRLGRAYNNLAPGGGRTLAGGLDAAALLPPRRFFGAARNLRDGGSLTILATALVETGSRMDDNLFEEFKGTGNMELRLSRALAEKRLYPAVDLDASGTRREEILLDPREHQLTWRLRRTLGGLDRQQALELLTDRLRETPSNAAFLQQVQQTT